MSNLHDSQKNPNQVNDYLSEMKPHEYYNKYIRLEGQKVLDEQEYLEKQKERDKIQSTLYQQYPLTPEDATINTGESN